MRYSSAFVLMFVLVGSAAATDLGNSSNVVKGNSHVLMNQSWDREGGEDMASAVPFTGVPFYDTGATCDNVDDYDVICPYEGSTSPDIVYSFTPAMDISITIDLDGSGYDTKVYVLDGDLNVIACNDDSHLPGYVSYLAEAVLAGGVEYFIVIDGYGTDCGDYVVNVTEFIPPEPCVLISDDCPEREPALVDGYEDSFNGGCNSVNFSFTDIGVPFIDGVGGWYLAADGSERRDTDWYCGRDDGSGYVEWTVDAESETDCYALEILDCDNITVTHSMTCGPCAPATMVFERTAYSVVYLFVGSTSYSQSAAGHPTNEYAYTMGIEGLLVGSPVESVSWCSVKSLYR